ncbi:MAG: translation elongation factor Ts [Acidobacteriota bacterium]
MTITAQAVKELRDRTGAGMMDCKKALTEAGGDLDEAVKVLRTKGLAAAAKKAHRSASEGVVVVVGSEDSMVVLELNCETDFVARNPEFVSFAEALANQALTSKTEDAAALLALPFAENTEHTVEETISQKVATIGENIVLSRLVRVDAAAGNRLNSYVHGGGKIGVVVEGAGGATDEALHDVALHVAATDPRFTNRDEVTEDVLATEREIALKQAMEAGKPEDIARRIVDGKMNKFFEQEVLLEQAFAKDPSKSVKQYLEEAAGKDATVVRFIRFKLGEGSDE